MPPIVIGPPHRQASVSEYQRAAVIEEELATACRATFPGVPVRLYVRHEDPTPELARVTSGGDRADPAPDHARGSRTHHSLRRRELSPARTV